jgi:hypothetical protein
MPLVIEDRVRETTIVTGTNDATLLGAVTGFQAFSVIGNNNTTYYTISDQSGGNWEVGLGTYSTAGPTLARTTVLSSSAGGSKVSFPAGTKDVFVTYPSEKAVYLDGSNNVQPALGTATITTGVFSAGTVSAPSITTTGDTNTGIYFPAADTIAFTEGGAESMRIDSSGNVGIGQAVPTASLVVSKLTTVLSGTANSYGVYVYPTSSGDTYIDAVTTSTGITDLTLRSYNNGTYNRLIGSLSGGTVTAFNTNGSERMRIDASGNIGIGTTSPATKLTILNNTALPSAGTISGTTIWSVGGNSANSYILMDAFGSSPIFTGRRAQGTVASPTASVSGNTLAMFAAYGYGSTGYSSSQRAQINLQSSETWTDSAQGTRISFLTTQIGTTSTTTKMLIDDVGNVGIGTTTPAYKLQVSSTQGTAGITSTTAGQTPYLILNNTADSSNSYIFCPNKQLGLVQSDTSASSIVYFSTQNTERMRIDSSGNVGIGTSSPTALLHVNGTARATSMSLNGVSIGDYNLYSGLVTRVSNGGGIGINSANSSDNAYIYFGSGTSSAAQQSAAIGRIGGDVLAMFTASAERMRIDSSGNVGIGTSSPISGYKLTVSGQGAFVGPASDVDGNAGVQINYGNASGTVLRFLALNANGTTNAALGLGMTDSSNGAMIFSTRGSNSLAERMRILANGVTQCTATTTLGPYFRAGNVNSVANNGTISVTNDTAGGALVCVYDPGSGNGGVFWVNYSATVTKIAGNGEATDTGSSFAVYKSANSHTTTFKNRTGSTTSYSIAVYSAYAYNS